MTVYSLGSYKVKKDGSSYYRVFKGRKRVASFLLLPQAVEHCTHLNKKDVKND